MTNADRGKKATLAGGAEPHRKGRALAERAGDVEPTAMAVDDVLDDRQTEAGAAQFARARRIDAVEPLGQPRQVFAGDAVALVGNRDRYHRGDRVAEGRRGDAD